MILSALVILLPVFFCVRTGVYCRGRQAIRCRSAGDSFFV